eukprot:m.242608 g.242608  ORF g.242608 m.242608 type:complete len:352 (+) comp25936_c0_seq1:31-1086(+)
MAEETKLFSGTCVIKVLGAENLDPLCTGSQLRCVFSPSKGFKERSGISAFVHNLSRSLPSTGDKKKVNTQLMAVSEELTVVWEPYSLRLEMSEADALKIKVQDEKNNTYSELHLPITPESLASTLDEPLSIPLDPRGTLRLALRFQPTGSMFGMDLEDTCRKEGRQVPRVVQQCAAFLERHGQNHEGLFRVPGSTAEVNVLRHNFDHYPVTLVSAHSEASDAPVSETMINNIATLLKSYLRDLPRGLVPVHAVPALRNLKSLPDEAAQVAGLAEALRELTPCARATLQFVLNLLDVIYKNAAVNKMSPENLATCFAPTLIPDLVNPMEAMPAIIFLITHSKLLAQISPPSA